jgi:hypothetical protein
VFSIVQLERSVHGTQGLSLQRAEAVQHVNTHPASTPFARERAGTPIERLKRLQKDRSINRKETVPSPSHAAQKSLVDISQNRPHGVLKGTSARERNLGGSHNRTGGAKMLEPGHRRTVASSVPHPPPLSACDRAKRSPDSPASGNKSTAKCSSDDLPAVASRPDLPFEALVDEILGDDDRLQEPRRLLQCTKCSRSFGAEAFVRHARVCERVFQSRRKPLDIKKHRLEGVVPSDIQSGFSGRGLATKQKKGSLTNGKALQPSGGLKGSAWRRKSEAFRNAMCANRCEICLEKSKECCSRFGCKCTFLIFNSSSFPQSLFVRCRTINKAEKRGEDITKLPLFQDEQDDRVPCPHCGRRFAPVTAERHIPKVSQTFMITRFLIYWSANLTQCMVCSVKILERSQHS